MMQKRLSFHLWVVGLLVLGACTSTPTATQSVTETRGAEEEPVEPVATQTESPTLTAGATELSGPSYTNPVYERDFPDPHIILVDDTYYAYATTNGSSVNIRVMRSPDLLTWEELGDALPAIPKWAMINAGFTWAPGVMQIEDQ